MVPEGRWVSRARRRGRALLLAGLLAVGACAPRPARPPNVLLITIDTLRADHLGAYGYGRKTSPRVDRLASGGALFEIAYAPMGATSPSHATLFTSRQPLAHGVVRNGFALPESELTLAELLRRNGYRTAAFVSAYPVSHRLGFAQGFDHFDDAFPPGAATLSLDDWEGSAVEGAFDRRAARTAEAALAWLREAPDAPLFVWVHFFDPHHPYDPPASFLDPAADAAGAIARYDGEIRYVDAQLGRVLEAFERASGERPPLVVLASDHGEGLRDHGWLTHNRHLYEEEVRIPLLFHWRGSIRAGLRSRQPAQLADVAPTLVSALALDAEGARFGGRDLSAFLLGSAAPDRERAIWLQRPDYADGRPALQEVGPGFGLRIRNWKLIVAPEEGRRELYDLVADPHERENLAEVLPSRTRELTERLRAWRAEQERTAAAAVLRQSPEDEAALRALGYAP